MSTLICSSIKSVGHVHRQTTKRRTRTTSIARSSPVEEQPVQNIIIEYEEKPEPVPEYRFAEVLNGRAAMQGFLWGSMN